MNSRFWGNKIHRRIMSIILCLVMIGQNFVVTASALADEPIQQTVQVESGAGERIDDPSSQSSESSSSGSGSDSVPQDASSFSSQSSNSDSDAVSSESSSAAGENSSDSQSGTDSSEEQGSSSEGSSGELDQSDSLQDSSSSAGSSSDSSSSSQEIAVEDFTVVLPEGKTNIEVRVGEEPVDITLTYSPEGAKPGNVEYTVADQSIAKIESLDSGEGGKLIAVSVPEGQKEAHTELTITVDEIKKTVPVIVLAAEEQFESLIVIAPEKDVITAEIGEEVTLQTQLNRNDVQVAYQWQKLQKAPQGISSAKVLYDYPEDAPTYYSFVWEDLTESEYLAQHPEATWPGIEMYYGFLGALEDVSADTSNIRIAWRTPNYILDGFTISANASGSEIYAEKDGQRYTARLNSEGKWAFEENAQEVTATWQDIDGANSAEYTFTVEESDYTASYRCVITVTDEEYKAKCLEILETSGTELTEEQKTAQQTLFSPAFRIESANSEIAPDENSTMSNFASMYEILGGKATNGNPALSDDAQWITGLTGYYEYITKDTYDRVTQWLEAGKITQEQADRYWTYLTPGGFSGETQNTRLANVLDNNGFPTGETRRYRGFDLTDGMLEVNSEWYGKTVYFRRDVNGKSAWGNTGTPIKIPAYTELSKDPGGDYIEGASGTKYKKAITFLNAFVTDTGSVYKSYLKGKDVSDSDGWILNMDGSVSSNHITVLTVDAEKFNADPQRYMMDAEGNYRVDSVGWGVCTYLEPDISGKAYWVLKDFISNGYGFISGHDTMYAYAGAYYDAFGVDLDESSIDPNDTTTWYYDVNSWMPGTTASTYEFNEKGEIVRKTGSSETRGGHFYMNELMGSNQGNVASKTTVPSDAPSLILSTGGSHGPYGKKTNFGGTNLRVAQNGYTAAQAQANAKYRSPVNYPFDMLNMEGVVNGIFPGAETHSNQQAAFGPIWVDYAGESIYAQKYGWEANPRYWTIDGKTGTNNFYLSGIGNYLMNQVGHLPENNVRTKGETSLFVNSVFYVSQRKQCEICAANQNGQETVHFVHRVNSANADQILKALQSGGTYWYPLNDCYMLTDNITLPEDWKPIENFSGHWNSDVYKVELNSKGTPLLANNKSDGEKGWNLGTNPASGTQNVFNKGMTRTTGVARVVGDLNDLFGTQKSYAGYVVKILGSDNPRYMGDKEVYSCTVNSDNKYVISNLPCVYDKAAQTGVLKARVYDLSGKELTEYGTIRANVNKDFWNNDMTIPLYLGSFSSEPVINQTTYESAHARFTASALADEEIKIQGWKYRTDDKSPWQDIPADWDVSVSNEVKSSLDGDYIAETKLSINNAVPGWDNYEFKAVFSSKNHGTWNTYEYWVNGFVANESSGQAYRKVATLQASGKLDVLLWPAYAQQGNNVTTVDGGSATFSSTGIALDGGDSIKAVWQYSTKEFDPFKGNISNGTILKAAMNLGVFKK